MSWQVLWEPAALNSAVAYLEADPVGVDALLEAADLLADDPQPVGSRAWGPDHRRLHRGPWRILYRTDPHSQSIHIEHVGRAHDR